MTATLDSYCNYELVTIKNGWKGIEKCNNKAKHILKPLFEGKYRVELLLCDTHINTYMNDSFTRYGNIEEIKN